MAVQTTSYVTGDAAFAVNRRGVIVLWNSAAENIFGFSSSQALGRHCWKLMEGLDIFGNRYCCERCPLMEMASRHESVHGTEVKFRTARNGRQPLTLSSLVDFGLTGEGLLLHICHPHEELPNPTENGTHLHSKSGNGLSLTHREHEVLTMLAEGMSTRKIADTLNISYATVRNHIQHTINKLHVHSRLEAVIEGQRLNLV